MTANEWLEVMQQAQDFPKGMTGLIKKYGELLVKEQLTEFKEKNRRLEFIIENGLGTKDLENDI